MNEHSEEFEDEEVIYEAEVPILTVSAGENEKGSVFRDFLNMRNEASFCDVAFVVQGTLFRAHRVVVSSWSRWLFAMLSEGPDQEIVSLDVFSPQEFGAVLDYMYGEPLEFSLANAEHMLKIVRRLELRVVEQKCWRFLLSIVNRENCVQLHQIADFFECAPLKISAWRIIQESKPGYSAAPTHMINSMRVNGNNAQARRSHGLTGPGEMDTASNQPHNHDDDDSDDDDVEFSIFSGNTPALSTEQSELADEGLLGSANKRYDHFIHPDKLPKGTPALQVVKAWSFRLQEVFAECCDHAEDMNIAEHAQAAASQRGESEDDQAEEQENEQRPISTFSDLSGANRVTSNPTPSSTPIMAQPRPSSVPTRQQPASRSALRESKAPSRLARPSRVQQPEVSITEEDTEQAHHSHNEQEQPHHQQQHEDLDQGKHTTYSTPSAPLDWRQELTDFYIANNLHEKIQSIDAILEAWHGRELDMMEVLHDKYRVEFDDNLRDRLSQ